MDALHVALNMLKRHIVMLFVGLDDSHMFVEATLGAPSHGDSSYPLPSPSNGMVGVLHTPR